MSTEDTTAQLREQIAGLQRSLAEEIFVKFIDSDSVGASKKFVVERLWPMVETYVEAAKATARRDALLEAADAIRKAKTMPAFEAWLRLRARASAQGVAPAEQGWS